ncbi:hypothetical protein BH23ACT10_BH23ACT10_22720 [soil metagenome]
MTVRLRKVRAGDAPALARAWLDQAQTYAALDPDAFGMPDEDGLGTWLADGLAEQADPDRRLVLVADVDDEAVGFVVAAVVPPHATPRYQMQLALRTTSVRIEALVVDQRRWREGIGNRLVVAAQDWARNRGAHLITAQAPAAGPASAFLTTSGYAPRATMFGAHL